MSDDVVEQAKSLMSGVTEGPWLYAPGDDEAASVISEGERSPDPITVGGITFRPGFTVALDLRNGDAKFIAEARTLVPELVAEVDRLRVALARVRERCEQVATDYVDDGEPVAANYILAAMEGLS